MINEPAPLPEMDLMQHLGELRRRLVISICAVAVGAVISFLYAKIIFDFLSTPYFAAFPNQVLIGTGLAEAFMLKIKVAIFGGALLMSPVLFHQLWLFVAPGLYPSERRLVFPFVISTTVLFLTGIWFCYHYVLPVALQFFHDEYASIGVTPTVRISEHMSLMLQALLGFGLVFQMPMLAFFLGRIGIITAKKLISWYRYAIVVIFVVAAIFTPPDIFSQFLMAGPLLILYGLSIVIVHFTGRRPGAEEEEPNTLPQ